MNVQDSIQHLLTTDASAADVLEGSGRFGHDLDPDSISKDEAELLPTSERLRLSKESQSPRPWKVTVNHRGDRRQGYVTADSPQAALAAALHQSEMRFEHAAPALVRHCINSGESSARVFDERFQIARNFR